MQTKKRAKSVSFGKKSTPEPEAASKKIEKVERVKEPEKIEQREKIEEVKKVEKVESEPITLSPEAIRELLHAQDEDVSSLTKTPEDQEIRESSSEVKAEKEKEPVAEIKKEKVEEEAKEVSPQVNEDAELVKSEGVDGEKVTSEGKEDEKERAMPSAFYSGDKAVRGSDRTHKKRPKYLVHFLVVALASFVLGLASMYGVDYALKNKIDLARFMPKPTPTAIPTPTKEPEVTVKEVDLSQYTIRILNGSGIKGEAAKLKAGLVAAGFKVDTLGNADTSDHVKTQVAAKEGVSTEYIKKLEEELGKSYTLDKVSKLSKTSVEDVAVTIGSEAAK